MLSASVEQAVQISSHLKQYNALQISLKCDSYFLLTCTFNKCLLYTPYKFLCSTFYYEFFLCILKQSLTESAISSLVFFSYARKICMHRNTRLDWTKRKYPCRLRFWSFAVELQRKKKMFLILLMKLCKD